MKEEVEMLYVKNVPAWERVVRLIMGVVFIAGSIVYFGPTTVGWVVGVIGAVAAMTGLIGFCPACAMVGRRLNR
jgi:hypothetical protein